MTRASRGLVALAFALLTGASSLADGSAVAERWAATLQETSAQLSAAQFEPARKRLETLKRDMLDQIGPGQAADRLFAATISQLAVAQAGSGRTEDAIWTWQIAQNLHPGVRDLDLLPFGPAGQLLKAHLLPPKPERCSRPNGAPLPKVIKRAEPEYPLGMRHFRESGLTIVQVQITEDGRAVEPLVVKALNAPITYATLEALRRWRFEKPPAAEPLRDAPFCMTFNFKLR